MKTPKFKQGDPVSYRCRNTTIADVDAFADGTPDYTVNLPGGLEGGIREHELGEPIPQPLVELNTADLIGLALDWAVDAAMSGKPLQILRHKSGNGEWTWFYERLPLPSGPRKFSTDWSQAGPLIEKHHISIDWNTSNDVDPNYDPEPWIAVCSGSPYYYGQTPLIAACRALVSAKLGDTVQVPEELTRG